MALTSLSTSTAPVVSQVVPCKLVCGLSFNVLQYIEKQVSIEHQLNRQMPFDNDPRSRVRREPTDTLTVERNHSARLQILLRECVRVRACVRACVLQSRSGRGGRGV